MRFSLSVFIVICIMFMSVTNSNAFRCGNEIPSLHDKSGAIQAKCGSPYQKSSGYENINGNNLFVEKWFYNCGEKDFIYEVSIHNGIVVKIDSIQRGSGIGQCQ